MGNLWSSASFRKKPVKLDAQQPTPPANRRRRGSADRRFSAVAAGKLVLPPDPTTISAISSIQAWIEKGVAAGDAGSLEFPFGPATFLGVTTLHLSRLGWGNPHLKLLSQAVLPLMPNLEELMLGFNEEIGDEGVIALAESTRNTDGGGRSLAKLKRLYLAGNRIGSDGCDALARALQEGAMPACTYLNLAKNPDAEESAWKVERELLRREDEQRTSVAC